MKIFKYLTIGLLAFSNIFINVSGQAPPDDDMIYASPTPPPLTQEDFQDYAESVLDGYRPQQEGLGKEYVENILKDIDRLYEMQKEGHNTVAMEKELEALYEDLYGLHPKIVDDYSQNSERAARDELKRTYSHSEAVGLSFGGGRKSKKKKRKSKKRKSKMRKTKRRRRSTKRK